MVKAVLFDLWGTLLETGIESPIKQIKMALNIRIPFHFYVVRLEKVMMVKEFSSLNEAFSVVCQEFGLRCPQWKIEELVGIWNKSWMLAKPYEEVLEVLNELKEKGIQVYLVSNTDNFSVVRALEKFEMEKCFDKCFFSYQMGKIKSDDDFFPTILKELNLQPEDCLMVGDSILSDMNARNSGIKSILLDRRGSREFEPKMANLKELEKFL